MCSLRFSDLSLLSTNTKLLIQGVLHVLEQVLLPVASCLFLAGTGLLNVWELANRVSTWEVCLDQAGYGNLVLGTCQSLERHLGTHT